MQNKEDLFTPFEIDAIGEIMNISLGSSATALSTLLDRRVDITTPDVKIQTYDEFEFTSLEPAVGIEITYTEGLEGSNILMLKEEDVKSIVEILMCCEIPIEEFELNEINLSAICEVMNQFMGASCTALSEFLGEPINMSTPDPFEIESAKAFKERYFRQDEPMIVIRFRLAIEAKMESEFINLMPINLAKRIIGNFGISDMAAAESAPVTVESTPKQPDVQINPPVQSQSEQPVYQNTASQQPQAPVYQNQPQAQQPVYQGQPQAQQPVYQGQPQAQQPVYQGQPQTQQPVYQGQPQAQQPVYQGQPQAQQPVYQNMVQPEERAAPRIFNADPIINAGHENLQLSLLPAGQSSNLELIKSVPLQVSVEIGRIRKSLKEILDFGQGTLVVLDKMAGEQADLFVNGQCIAKGDVVVVDDSFGIRITEIIKNNL